MAHLTRVKSRLSLHAHRKVRGLLQGEYAAVQTGRGIDFNDLREYVRGDDVKDIDWKASARTRSLLVKRYVAERKHTILLCVSTGRSMAAMNDARVAKRDLAVLVAGMVGYLAVDHKDLVALVHGHVSDQHVRPPRGGELHLERLLAEVHDTITPDAPAADLTAVLRYAARAVRRRTILLVVADEREISRDLADALKRLTVQHEVLFVTIGDLDPTSAPEDDAAGRLVDIDSGSAVPDWIRGDTLLQEEYSALVRAEEADRRRRLDQLGIVHEHVHDGDSAVAAVFRLLERHRHAVRR